MYIKISDRFLLFHSNDAAGKILLPRSAPVDR
jgi:hypothetical protein